MENDPNTSAFSRISAALRRSAGRCLSAGVDFAFPPICTGCGENWNRQGDQPLLCPECLTAVAPLEHACRRCAAPAAPSAKAVDDCALCRGVKLHFDRAVVLGVYRDRLREFVLRMKHAAGESLSLAMGDLLAEAATRKLPQDLKISCVAPIPMPWTRRLTRTANSAELLSEAIGSRLKLPVFWGALRCRRNPKRQSSLPPSKRFANVRHAYRASKGYDFMAAHVLLVDDIMTTAATASEAAKVLKRAGAATVSVAAVARGVGDT